jgi:xanthine dehydrogenase small subunit
MANPGTDRSAIRFVLNGQSVAIEGVSPQTMLLEYLREHRHLTGTKEGCAEGDCGACTVVLAEPGPDDNLRWRPVNACIRPLPSVDGKAVVTVEGLEAGDGTHHPVQRALVDCHASQCGFCTPGFAMSLFGLYKNALAPSRAEVEDALSGNLCRCTGYRPILDAARAMYEPALAGTATGWRGPGMASDGSRAATPDEKRLGMELALLTRPGTFSYTADGQRWWSPRSLDALAALRVEHPDARIVAGATDVGLWVTKHQRHLGDVIYVGEVAELTAIHRAADGLHIGAAASLSDAFAAMDSAWPELREVWSRFASVPIRNSGTLGGNVANGSPIGDSMPALIALRGAVVLRRGAETRTMPIEDFYLDYQKTALRPGEFVASLHVPVRDPDLLVRAYKISKRYDQDISAVFACFALKHAGGKVLGARIGCGGVATTPRRALATEAALAGKPWADATAEAAAQVLAAEFAPISDMRASAAYRRTVLANLLRRFRLETGGARVPTRVEQIASVALSD